MLALTKQGEQLSKILIHETQDYSAYLWRQYAPLSSEAVQGRPFFLGLSLRSPKFNRKLVTEFALLTKRFSHSAYITTFNYPLIFNILAKGSSVEEFEHEFDILRKLDGDAERMVERIISQPTNDPEIRFLKFEQLFNCVPESYFIEIRNLFLQNRFFQQKCIDHVKKTFSIAPDQALGKKYTLVEYFVFELPILLYLAYSFEGGVVDVYPGVNPSILWEFDAGHYDSHCPQIAKDRQQSAGLLYVELVTRPQ